MSPNGCHVDNCSEALLSKTTMIFMLVDPVGSFLLPPCMSSLQFSIPFVHSLSVWRLPFPDVCDVMLTSFHSHTSSSSTLGFWAESQILHLPVLRQHCVFAERTCRHLYLRYDHSSSLTPISHRIPLASCVQNRILISSLESIPP